MSMEGLRAVEDPSVGDWIDESRSLGADWTPTPGGYEAYARIFHPAGSMTRWSEVCAATGRTPHVGMQWNSIARSAASTLWEGVAPDTGNLEPVTLARVIDVLAKFTTSRETYFGIWEGFGFVNGGEFVATIGRGTWKPAMPEVIHDANIADRLNAVGRDLLLFSGDLDAVLHIGSDALSELIPQSPTVMWPEERAWCLSTEVDFDSTLLAGSRALIDAVLRDERIEALEFNGTLDLTIQGDLINH